MTRTAYLNVCIDIRTHEVLGVATHSASGGEITTELGKHRWITLLDEIGDSYQDAQDNLRCLVYSHPYYQWLIPLLDKDRIDMKGPTPQSVRRKSKPSIHGRGGLAEKIDAMLRKPWEWDETSRSFEVPRKFYLDVLGHYRRLGWTVREGSFPWLGGHVPVIFSMKEETDPPLNPRD
jgi:hypothetical protein